MYDKSWVRFKRIPVTVFNLARLLKLNDDPINFNMIKNEKDNLKLLEEYLVSVDTLIDYILNQIYFIMVLLSELFLEAKIHM